MDTFTLATLVENVTTWFTAVIGWMGDLIDVIVSNPVLLTVVVILPITGFAVGMLSRLFNLSA